MRVSLFFLLLILCGTVSAATPPATKAQYWADVLDAGLVAREPLERESYAWPETHSVSFPFDNQIAEEQNTRYREMATVALQQLRALSKKLEGLDRNLSDDEHAALLVLRSRFSKRNAYINALLTDCVERILVQDLLEILADPDTLSQPAVKRTEHLRLGELDLHKYSNMCAKELGQSFDMFSSTFSYQEHDREALIGYLRAFWSQLTEKPLQVVFPLGTVESAMTEQRLELLFQFRLHTEYVRRTVLPCILEYRRWAGPDEYVLNHDYQRIRDLCGKQKLPKTWSGTPKLPKSCVSLLHLAFRRNESQAMTVSSALRAVRQDKTFLGFY